MSQRFARKLRLTNSLKDEFKILENRVMEVYFKVFSQISMGVESSVALSCVSKQEFDKHKSRMEEILELTDRKYEKCKIVETSLMIEKIFSNGVSDDFGRYCQIGLKINPEHPEFNRQYGMWLAKIQQWTPSVERDYSYIEWFHKAYKHETDPDGRVATLRLINDNEARHEFCTGSMREIKHLVQLDDQPLDFAEPRWEIYKLSVSFAPFGNIENMETLAKKNHRILFQNADGNINMGVWLNDPDIEMREIFWYNILAQSMNDSLVKNEGLVTIDADRKTRSCYVEMHSHPIGLNGQNHIIALTPLKLLPVKDFEKQQKSIDTNKNLAIMSSMMERKHESDVKKNEAKEAKEKGNKAFQRKNYEEAEKWYSKGIKLHPGFRPLWTNRAICRNAMKEYEKALFDCHSALLVDSKCTKTIAQKGNANLGLARYDEARECYETLRTLGEENAANSYEKKLDEAQFPALVLSESTNRQVQPVTISKPSKKKTTKPKPKRKHK